MRAIIGVHSGRPKASFFLRKWGRRKELTFRRLVQNCLKRLRRMITVGVVCAHKPTKNKLTQLSNHNCARPFGCWSLCSNEKTNLKYTTHLYQYFQVQKPFAQIHKQSNKAKSTKKKREKRERELSCLFKVEEWPELGSTGLLTFPTALSPALGCSGRLHGGSPENDCEVQFPTSSISSTHGLCMCYPFKNIWGWTENCWTKYTCIHIQYVYIHRQGVLQFQNT